MDKKEFLVNKAEHSACISFWIPKRQAISTDTSFETKMLVKSGAIEIYFQMPQALSELPANWPGRFSQKGWLGLAS